MADLQALIAQAAQEQNVPVDVLTALLTQESGNNPQAQNASGATGIAQLMPGTARQLGVTDPTDITQAVPAAAKYLRKGLDANDQDMTKALKYYYGGPDERLWGPKTQAYPGQVMARVQPAQGVQTAQATTVPSIIPPTMLQQPVAPGRSMAPQAAPAQPPGLSQNMMMMLALAGGMQRKPLSYDPGKLMPTLADPTFTPAKVQLHPVDYHPWLAPVNHNPFEV